MVYDDDGRRRRRLAQDRESQREGGSRRSTAASDACPQIAAQRERGERERERYDNDKILYLAKQKILKHFRNCEAL